MGRWGRGKCRVASNPPRGGDVFGAAPAPPQGQSAAVIRKTQLEQMKERERLKRLERLGGGGQERP